MQHSSFSRIPPVSNKALCLSSPLPQFAENTEALLAQAIPIHSKNAPVFAQTEAVWFVFSDTFDYLWYRLFFS